MSDLRAAVEALVDDFEGLANDLGHQKAYIAQDNVATCANRVRSILAAAPEPDEAALTERVAAVLAEHVRVSWADQPYTCMCEPDVSDGTRPYRAHVATAIVTALRSAP